MPDLPDSTIGGQAEFNVVATLVGGAKRWLLSLAGPSGTVHLPAGKLTVPEGGFSTPLAAEDLPPAGRVSIMLVDGALSLVDSAGGVTPV